MATKLAPFGVSGRGEETAHVALGLSDSGACSYTYEMMLDSRLSLRGGLRFNPRQNGSSSYIFYHCFGRGRSMTFKAAIVVPSDIIMNPAPAVVGIQSRYPGDLPRTDVLTAEGKHLGKLLLRCATALEVLQSADEILSGAALAGRVGYNNLIEEKKVDIKALISAQRDAEQVELLNVIDGISAIKGWRLKKVLSDSARGLLGKLPESREIDIAMLP